MSNISIKRREDESVNRKNIIYRFHEMLRREFIKF